MANEKLYRVKKEYEEIKEEVTNARMGIFPVVK